MNQKEHREQAVKDAKCGLILAAARKVFSEKGYQSARLEDIAAEAGFSKPSLYSYFPDKETLFLSLANQDIQEMSEKIELAANAQEGFTRTIESMLRIVFTNFAQTFSYFTTAANFKSFNSLQMDAFKNKEHMDRFHEIMRKTLGSIEKVLTRARNAREISSRAPSADLAWFIISMIQSVHMRSFMTGKMVDMDASISRIMDFIMHGVAGRTQS
jgi:AcrR family transcriptional regulator